jgi:hypothetical protein
MDKEFEVNGRYRQAPVSFRRTMMARWDVVPSNRRLVSKKKIVSIFTYPIPLLLSHRNLKILYDVSVPGTVNVFVSPEVHESPVR